MVVSSAMSLWPILVAALSGLAALIASPWLLSRAGRKWGSDPIDIKPPTYRFTGFAPDLRAQAEARRSRADLSKREAAAIASGRKA